MQTRDRTEAPLGAMTAADIEGLPLMEEVLLWRDGAINRLYGTRRKRSALTDALLRRIIILFANQTLERVPYYQSAFAAIASASTVLLELREMEAFGLVVLRPVGVGRKSLLVAPTNHLVWWHIGYFAELKARSAMCR
jgi:hypothetical protein